MSIKRGILYRCAKETMPLMDAKKAVVLHQHGRLDPGKVRSGRDADTFFLLRQSHQNHLRILVRHSDEMHQPGFRQS